MAIGKEVKTKINSVKSTQKITSAMEMVAASKMRRAQEQMALGKPYAERIRAVVGHIANASSEYRHAYMVAREVKRVGFIIVATDRGLCGGLNTNLFKAVLKAMVEWQRQGVAIDICTVGSKASAFFGSRSGDVVATVRDLGDSPSTQVLVGSVKVMLDSYEEKRIDRLYLAGNKFLNTMSQQPAVEQLLPLEPVADDKIRHHWDYLYEPDAKELLDGLLARYIESQVYQGVVENKACEQAARMVAMKSATENAGNLIGELELLYNKARQAAITQELSEIVSGAAAV
jgi:F-type H+-transporting ATPase subunit gamma